MARIWAPVWYPSRMSDILAPATPFPPEGSAPPPEATPDPLAGDWSAGLRGPLRALGIPEPKLLSLEGMAQPPAPVRQPVESPPSAPAEAVEAPAGWAAPSEDPLHSQPHRPAPIPSVIVDITPPSPAPV